MISVITKRCKECKQVKDVDAFYKTSGSTCKECVKCLQRIRYSQNRTLLQGRTKQCLRKRLDKLYQYLQRHPCVDCGCTDIVVLQFDHVRGDKIGNISKLVNTCGWQTVMNEITKCEVVCGNCHARRTANARGYLRAGAEVVCSGYGQTNSVNILKILEMAVCMDCGESDSVLLEFDHRNPIDKINDIAVLRNIAPWSIVAAEIDKCDIVCVNCHLRRTAQQQSWYRLEFV